MAADAGEEQEEGRGGRGAGGHGGGRRSLILLRSIRRSLAIRLTLFIILSSRLRLRASATVRGHAVSPYCCGGIGCGGGRSRGAVILSSGDCATFAFVVDGGTACSGSGSDVFSCPDDSERGLRLKLRHWI